MLPSQIYEAYRSYKQGVIPRPSFTQEQAFTAAANIEVEMITVPQEYDMICSSLCAVISCGGALTLTDAMLYIVAPRGVNCYIKGIMPGTGGSHIFNFEGSLYVPADHTLKLVANFSAATSAHFVIGSALGYLIPRID